MNILNPFRKWGVDENTEGPLFGAVRDAIIDAQAYARSHGGEIRLLGVSQSGDVTIQLRGACAMCPLSTVTIRLGVENRLRELIPEIGRIIVK